MQMFMEKIYDQLAGFLPTLGAALALLIGGWLISLLVSAGVGSLLKRTDLDNRLAEKLGFKKQSANVDQIISRFIFYLLMAVVLIAFFSSLGLSEVTQPFNSLLTKIFSYAGNLLGALVLAAIAWIVASVVRLAIMRALGAIRLDENLAEKAGLEGKDQIPLSETLGKIVYGLILLLFLPMILDSLGMEGLLGSVTVMLDKMLAFLPNTLHAVVIFVVGYFLAKILSQIVTGLIAAAGGDRLGEKIGLETGGEGEKISSLVGMIVYALVLIPALIASLESLGVEAVSGPATEMLSQILGAVPHVVGACIVLGICYIVGKVVSSLVANILTGIGFNKVLTLVGLGEKIPQGQKTPSQMVGYIVLVAIMLFASLAALNLLGFDEAADLVKEFVAFTGQILLGVLVFGLGLFLANLVADIVRSSGAPQAAILARVARVAIIILTAAMALRQMGIADDIVNLAFGLVLGSLALAGGLAFGLGCRDLASREVEKLIKK